MSMRSHVVQGVDVEHGMDGRRVVYRTRRSKSVYW
jgi:hypothetical protein